MPAVQITETAAFLIESGATPLPGKGRRYRARIIAGDIQGSSGYYPASTLRRDAGVFREGLAVFFDHPSYTEKMDRPERSVRDLAGKLVTTAKYERDGLYAEVEVYPHAVPIIEAMAGDIGMSIRAAGMGEASKDPKIPGPIITSLTSAASVDFVTAAGAGGKLVTLLESARPTFAAEGHGLGANDLRAALDAALRDTCRGAGGDVWAWVRDYTDDYVVFDLSGDTPDLGTYQQSYVVDTSGTVTLTGAPVEVNVQTAYVPQLPDAEDAALAEALSDLARIHQDVRARLVAESTTIPKEGPVAPKIDGAPPEGGSTDLTEAERARIAATEARIAGLQAEIAELREGAKFRNDAAVQLVEARRLNAVADARITQLEGIEDARDAVTRVFAESTLPPAAQGRVIAAVIGFKGQGLPLTEAGALDLDKVKAKAKDVIDAETTYVAQLAEAAGYGGKVRSMGGAGAVEVTEASAMASLEEAFNGLNLPAGQAAVAAKGR